MILALLMAINVFAHGEDKPGPHGGFISMPGAFHVEVLPKDDRRFEIYLLDIEWKNPSIKDSNVTLEHGKAKAKCKGLDNHFVCEFAKPAKTGELKVTANREFQQGAPVPFKLPLSR